MILKVKVHTKQKDRASRSDWFRLLLGVCGIYLYSYRCYTYNVDKLPLFKSHVERNFDLKLIYTKRCSTYIPIITFCAPLSRVRCFANYVDFQSPLSMNIED
jgi:hypothetical protein